MQKRVQDRPLGETKKRQTAPRISEAVIRAAKIRAAETDKEYHEIVEAAIWHFLRCKTAGEV